MNKDTLSLYILVPAAFLLLVAVARERQKLQNGTTSTTPIRDISQFLFFSYFFIHGVIILCDDGPAFPNCIEILLGAAGIGSVLNDRKDLFSFRKKK